MTKALKVKEWTVIFLVDDIPISNIVLLKRSSEKDFAPNWFTGIGGKVGDLEEFKDETFLESAYRELAEETEESMHKNNTTLTEFARCFYEEGLKLYYFWTKFPYGELPNMSSNDGSLEWVSKEDLLSRNIIPTTKAVCEEWSSRNFAVDHPFTVMVKEVGVKDGVRMVDRVGVKNKLVVS
jgi:8-oxo-dGTP pyrophosphatase MutT (NUDIX family)